MTRPFALALAFAAGACTTSPADPDQRSAEEIAINPYAVHEACFPLAEGDRLDWRFEAREPVDFNVHYHDGPMILMPITREKSRGDAGIFPVLVTHDYCAMFEAGPSGAIVSYRMRRLRPER